MRRPLPRGTIAQAVERGEMANVIAECIKELQPLQKEEAEVRKAATKTKRKPGPKPTEPFIRAAYADIYPEGHGLTPLTKMRDTLRAHIKKHFRVWTDIDDKTFQRYGF